MPGPAKSLGPDDYTPAEAAQYVWYTFINNCVLFATATVLVYELLTSLDDERQRVWTLKWRMPKILFVFNRYVIRAMLVALWVLAYYPGMGAEFCRIYAYWQMLPLRLAVLAAQALVVIRVWAIYNNSRPMLFLLSFLYTLEVIAVLLCVLVATIDTQGIAQPPPLSCALSSRSGYLLPNFASGTWIAPLCFEFIMVCITLAKLVPRWKWGRRHGFLGSGGNATVDVLARDSLIYFLLIFMFSLATTVLYEYNFKAYYHSILLGPTSAVSCIAVSRMMINIRAAAPQHSPGDGEEFDSERVELSFAPSGPVDEFSSPYLYADERRIPGTARARASFFPTPEPQSPFAPFGLSPSPDGMFGISPPKRQISDDAATVTTTGSASAWDPDAYARLPATAHAGSFMDVSGARRSGESGLEEGAGGGYGGPVVL